MPEKSESRTKLIIKVAPSSPGQGEQPKAGARSLLQQATGKRHGRALYKYITG